MTSLVFAPRALADLDGIWEYSARTWDLDQADHYLGDIHETCLALASGRKVGREIGRIRAGYRQITSGSHFIVYRVRADSLEISRVLHRRMDVDRHL